jgi:hypothetical protein
MKNLATELGKGSYFYIRNFQDISATFASALGGAMTTIAKDISIRYEVPADVSVVKIPTKYPFSCANDANSVCVLNISDIQSEEHKDILFFLHLSSIPVPLEEFSVGKLTVEYTNSVTNERRRIEKSLKIQRTEETVDQKPNLEVDKNRNRILVAEALEKASHIDPSEDLLPIREEIIKVSQRIKNSNSATDEYTEM